MKILYVKHNSERDKKYQISTLIFEGENGKKYVKKIALNDEAISHITKIEENYFKLKNTIIGERVKLSRILDKGRNYIVFEYIHGTSLLSKYLSEAMLSIQKSFEVLKEYEKIIFENFSRKKFLSTQETSKQLIQLFGNLDYSRLNGKTCFETVSNIDLTLSNIIVSNGIYYIIDYEWVFDINLPMEYIMYRSFYLLPFQYRVSIQNHPYFKKYFISIYEKMENHFIQKIVYGKNSFFCYKSQFLRPVFYFNAKTEKEFIDKIKLSFKKFVVAVWNIPVMRPLHYLKNKLFLCCAKTKGLKQ